MMVRLTSYSPEEEDEERRTHPKTNGDEIVMHERGDEEDWNHGQPGIAGLKNRLREGEGVGRGRQVRMRLTLRRSW